MFDGRNWTNFSNIEGSPWGNSYIKIFKIDSKNQVWLGEPSVLFKKDFEDWMINKCFDADGNDCLGHIQAMEFDKDDLLWIGTNRQNILSYNGSYFETYEITDHSFSGVYAESIAVDEKNNVWIGSCDGLLKYDRSKWTLYNTSNSNILHNCILSIKAYQGKIWLGSSNGLTEFKHCGGEEIEMKRTRINASSADASASYSISIFPNPAKDILYINYNLTAPAALEFELFNVSGESVLNGKTDSDISTGQQMIPIPPSVLHGIYILRVQTTNAVLQKRIFIAK
jgi:hypothetical protein